MAASGVVFARRLQDDPDAYRAIPYGGWKVLARILATIAAAVGCVTIGFLGHPISQTDNFFLTIFAAFVMMIVVGIVGTMAVLYYGFLFWVFPMVKEYYRRNVRGYNAWYHQCNGEGGGAIGCMVLPTGAWPIDMPCCDGSGAFRVEFVIALGGWRNHSSVHWRDQPSNTWTIAKRHPHDSSEEIRLVDGVGSAQRISIASAIALFSWMLRTLSMEGCLSKDGHSDIPFLWSTITERLIEYRQRAEDARGRLIAQVVQLEKDQHIGLRNAGATIDTAIRAIAKADRFRSTEARTIRRDLIEGLLGFLPTDDPRREPYTRELAKIRADEKRATDQRAAARRT